MLKFNSNNQGQSLIRIIIALVVVGLITGGLYYYLSKQFPEVPEIVEKPLKEEVKPEEVASPPEEELPEEEVVPEEIPPEEKIEEKPAEKPIVQKCADGTLYGQCSANKPKYCENGNLIEKASLCGCPSGYKISDNSCTIEIPKFDTKSGLIVIRKGVNGESYAREIASSKGWDILTVNTSDYNQIKNEILSFYNQKKFNYLLLIGTNEEIPYAGHTGRGWETDPTLYGDIDNDRFIELAVGRLPFSSEVELKKYFLNLEPKGNFITLEHYAHWAEDPHWEYTYGKCLAFFSSYIRVYKYTNPLDLVKHYRESTMLILRDAGTPDSVYSAGMPPDPNRQIPILHKASFCKDFTGNLEEYMKGGPECEIEYLTNRPIIIHYSCNNAQQLGPQLIDIGAAAFLGFYKEGGYFYQLGPQLLVGKTIGESVKNTYNGNILLNTIAIKGTLTRGVREFEGLNTFNIVETKLLSETGILTFILFGDPSLKVPERFQRPNYNLNIEQQIDKIVIKAKSPKLFPLEKKSIDSTDLLCYTGEAVFGPPFIHKELWGKDHQLNLIFPITKINRLKSQKVIIGDKKIILDLNKENYKINLLKGKREQYLSIIISDTIAPPTEPTAAGMPKKTSRLDYTKDLQILIEYE